MSIKTLTDRYALIDQLEELTFLYWVDRKKFEKAFNKFLKKLK